MIVDADQCPECKHANESARMTRGYWLWSLNKPLLLRCSRTDVHPAGLDNDTDVCNCADAWHSA